MGSRGFSSPPFRIRDMNNRAKVLFILLATFSLIASSLVVVTLPLSSNEVLAAGEGEGTATINPTTVTAGSTGNTLTITYTAGATAWNNGSLTITIPTGWSAPSTTGTEAGYVTASAGTRSVSAQVITVSGITMSARSTVTVTYGNKTAGGSGATAQTTAGTATFTVKSDPDGGGPLTALTAGSPTVTVTTPPAISFSPSSLSFTAARGGVNPSSQTLGISNSGGGALTWSLSDDAEWLTLNPTTGTTTSETDNVILTVNISGMSAGSYSGTITISATGATNTPRTVAVSLRVTIFAPATETAGTAESWVDTPDGRVIVHFPAGSFASNTTVTIEPLTTCPSAPAGYSLGETCFSITAGAALLKPIDVCVRYSNADVTAAGGDPHKLRLVVYDGGVGKVLSTDIDERTQTACARVNHLSDFAIVAGPAPGEGFWSVWWHILVIVVGVAIVIAIAVWRLLRYRYLLPVLLIFRF